MTTRTMKTTFKIVSTQVHTQELVTGAGRALVTDMPGCPQVQIIHGSTVPVTERGKGVGSIAHTARLKFLKKQGNNYVLCTVEAGNEPQLRIIRKNGWKELDRFHNKCTSHEIIIFGKTL